MFREVFLNACADSRKELNNDQEVAVRRGAIADPRRKRIAAKWAKFEKAVAALHLKQNGEKVGAWQDVIKWMLENLPAIIAMFIKIFGGL